MGKNWIEPFLIHSIRGNASLHHTQLRLRVQDPSISSIIFTTHYYTAKREKILNMFSSSALNTQPNDKTEFSVLKSAELNLETLLDPSDLMAQQATLNFLIATGITRRFKLEVKQKAETLQYNTLLRKHNLIIIIILLSSVHHWVAGVNRQFACKRH